MATGLSGLRSKKDFRVFSLFVKAERELASGRNPEAGSSGLPEGLQAALAEAAVLASGSVQLADFFPARAFAFLEYQLADAVAIPDCESLV